MGKTVDDAAFRAGLAADHYRVSVTYAPMPFLADLNREFGEVNVSMVFDDRAWELHGSCADMNRTPGERIFYVHDVGRDWKKEEQISWGLQQRNAVAPKGYRSATHDEMYEFSNAHPEIVDYVALGDSTLMSDGSRCVANVWSEQDGQRMLIVWLDRWFSARHRVLFVSKQHLDPRSLGS